jgi:hypothetical protein
MHHNQTTRAMLLCSVLLQLLAVCVAACFPNRAPTATRNRRCGLLDILVKSANYGGPLMVSMGILLSAVGLIAEMAKDSLGMAIAMSSALVAGIVLCLTGLIARYQL